MGLVSIYNIMSAGAHANTFSTLQQGSGVRVRVKKKGEKAKNVLKILP